MTRFVDISFSPQVRREMMPEVDSFDPFVTSQNRRGHPRSYSQYYEGIFQSLIMVLFAMKSAHIRDSEVGVGVLISYH